VDIPVHDGARLPVGVKLPGPALVQTRLTVALIPPGCMGHMTARGGLMIDVA